MDNYFHYPLNKEGKRFENAIQMLLKLNESTLKKYKFVERKLINNEMLILS